MLITLRELGLISELRRSSHKIDMKEVFFNFCLIIA